MVSYMRTVRDCLQQHDQRAALAWANIALEESGDPQRNGQPSGHVTAGHVGAAQQGETPLVGEMFIRGDVPSGPIAARLAWARAMENLAVIVAVYARPSGSGTDVVFEIRDVHDKRVRDRCGVDAEDFLKHWRRP